VQNRKVKVAVKEKSINWNAKTIDWNFCFSKEMCRNQNAIQDRVLRE